MIEMINAMILILGYRMKAKRRRKHKVVMKTKAWRAMDNSLSTRSY
jgi:hypothetical protein